MREKDFDCYQRYTALKSVLDAAYADAPETAAVSVLDVGSGSTTLSRDFLGGRYRITRSDVNIDTATATDLVSLQPGQPLPFGDRSYQAVIAMDVLEHVRPAERALFVRECIRVSRDVCILAVPTAEQAVEEAEARVYAVHRSRLGAHDYFEEHLSYGLPRAGEIERWIAAEGAALLTLPNVPLLAWETFSCLDFIGYSDERTRDLTMDAHLLENAAFPAVCSDGLHYRTFHIACRTPEAHARLKLHVDALRDRAAPLAADTPLALAWRVIATSCEEARQARTRTHEQEVRTAQASAELAAARAQLESTVQAKQQLEAYAQQQVQLLREHQATLAAILNSRSWRYMEVFRKAARALRRMSGRWRAQG
jgi:hypothetical protein